MSGTQLPYPERAEDGPVHGPHPGETESPVSDVTLAGREEQDRTRCHREGGSQRMKRYQRIPVLHLDLRSTTLYNSVIWHNAVILFEMVDVNSLDDVGVRLVDTAGRILSDEGLAGLSLRRLAAQAGASTMVVYTRFGDKDGLLAAMHAEGFRRLEAALRDAADRCPADPLAALAEMGLAYRRTALDNRHLYSLMFGAAAPGFQPDEAGRAIADSAYEPLVEGVQKAIASGDLVGGDPGRVALYLWAVSHGFVSLEIAGKVGGDEETGEAIYRDALLLSAVPFVAARPPAG